MCGIAGLVGCDRPDLLKSMNDCASYRGPDDSGYFSCREHQVALAMRRLSIIDLKTGHQPMSNEDDSLWVVCNGEIYNSPQLRRQLMGKGHRFKTQNSDVEVLLHLYEEKGVDLVSELNGMYAFVIYDKAKNVLFGARDRVGIKPLYYCRKNGIFAFASELKCLMLLPEVSKDINQTSLYHYFSLQFIPAPETIFADIHKLPAGHFFVYEVSQKKLTVSRYWSLNVRKHEELTEEQWQEQVRGSLLSAVKRWTLSDVPVACSLSGGIDSSALVGIATQSGIKGLKAYSVGFNGAGEQDCDEMPLARAAAQKWNIEHEEVVVNASRVLEDLDQMVWHLDEPYAGGLPSWYVYESVGKERKVCLTGTGGDELFSNYGKYRIFEKPGWYRTLKTIRDALQNFDIKEITDGMNYPLGHFWHHYFSDACKDKVLFKEKNPGNCSTASYVEKLWQESGADNPRDAVAYIDFKLQLPEEFLLMTDRFSMAHSVEARVPFLDHELVELVFGMPAGMRIGSGHKDFLKKIVRDYIPGELLTAPKKGFVLPLTVWTRRELRPNIEGLLSPDYLRRQGIFSPRCYEKIVRPHLEGKRDLTQQVWTLFMFQKWHEKYLG